MHDARAVANFLLDYAELRGKKLTIMALLKILYFAHGWHLAKFGSPLVRNGFEAWRDGPVVRSVYYCFRQHRKDPIRTRATRFDPATEKYEKAKYYLNDEQAGLLKWVFDTYGHLNAFQLSSLTHEPGSPWDLIWNGPRDKIVLGMRISDDLIRGHFLMSSSTSPLH